MPCGDSLSQNWSLSESVYARNGSLSESLSAQLLAGSGL